MVRPDIDDGKTEWFLLGSKEILQGVERIRTAMQILFGDKENDVLKAKKETKDPEIENASK